MKSKKTNFEKNKNIPCNQENAIRNREHNSQFAQFLITELGTPNSEYAIYK